MIDFDSLKVMLELKKTIKLVLKQNYKDQIALFLLLLVGKGSRDSFSNDYGHGMLSHWTNQNFFNFFHLTRLDFSPKITWL